MQSGQVVLYRWRRFLEEGGNPEAYEEILDKVKKDIRSIVRRTTC